MTVVGLVFEIIATSARGLSACLWDFWCATAALGVRWPYGLRRDRKTKLYERVLR